MKLIFPFIFLLAFSCNSSKSTAKKNSPEQLQKEALAFSLKAVQDIFNEDCEAYTSKFTKELYALDGDGIFKIEDVKNKICGALKGANRDNSKKYSDYLNDYKQEALTIEEFKEIMEFPEYFISTESDFIFRGYKMKNKEIKSYIFADLFFFLVRKENGKWVIKGAV